MSQPQSGTGSVVYEVLSTKLVPPRMRGGAIVRTALLRRLDAAATHRLLVVCAPAGFGKTTLVARWLEERGEPYGWLSLDASDSDPVRFWRHVLAACERIGADTAGLHALLQESDEPPWMGLLIGLVNRLAALAAPARLVLEDYQEVESSTLDAHLSFLVEHLPSAVQLVVITRREPRLPIAKLRAQDDVEEIGARELRFTAAEIEAFVAQNTGIRLDARELARLSARTEGWAAGLRLVTLATAARPPEEARSIIAGFTGDHRHVVEYLTSEVLARQPTPVRDFLLRTAFLERVTPGLCDAVTGRTDSERLLTEIEAANLFLSELTGDGSRRWYRYHALFAEALHRCAREELGEAAQLELYDRASRWYEEADLLEEAVECALAARDFPLAARLLDRIVSPELVRNQYRTLRRWLDALPASVIERYPRLCQVHAAAIIFTSDRKTPAALRAVDVPLARAEKGWREAGNTTALGEVHVLRSLARFWQGEAARAQASAREALTLLPEDENQWRGIALGFVGWEALSAGRYTEAVQLLEDALRRCTASGNRYGVCSSLVMLAWIAAQQGDPARANEYHRRVLEITSQGLMNPYQVRYNRCRALLGLAALAWERNDASGADLWAREAGAVARQIRDTETRHRAALLRGRIAYAQGRRSRALRRMAVLVGADWPDDVADVARMWRARLALAESDLTAVRRWYASRRSRERLVPTPEADRERLVLARLLVADGEAAAAVPLVTDVATRARADGRLRDELEAALVGAIACAQQVGCEAAGERMLAVAGRAHDAGFFRLLLDEGRPLLPLLQAAARLARQEPIVAFLRAAADAIDAESAGGRARRDESVSVSGMQLTPKEMQVLRLLGDGLSNPDIARELFVSVNTVKTHVKAIYRKLDIRNRREARGAARQLIAAE